MDKRRMAESSEREKIETVSRVMKLVTELDGGQLGELRRFVDLLVHIREQQFKGDGE